MFSLNRAFLGYQCLAKFFEGWPRCTEKMELFYYSINSSGLLCFLDIREGKHYVVTWKELGPAK